MFLKMNEEEFQKLGLKRGPVFNLVNFVKKIKDDEHKDDWVLVYKQEVKKYGPEYTSKELEDLEEEMPGAIYLPVDKSRHDVDITLISPTRCFTYHSGGQTFQL
jgi:hypothetical protein